MIASKLGNLTVLEQQFARSARLVVEPVAVAVFRDVAVDEPDLVAFDGRGFRRSILAMAERLHFRAGQLNLGFEAVLDEIIETRAPVLGDDLLLVERLLWRLGHDEIRVRPACSSASSTARFEASDASTSGRRISVGKPGRTRESAYFVGAGDASLNSAACSG